MAVNALAAQAILAWTFAMENIKSGRVKQLHGADVSTSVEESQAYDPEINDNVRKAVEATRGEVVTYGGNYIHAWLSVTAASQPPRKKAWPTPRNLPLYQRGSAGRLSVHNRTKNKAWEARIFVAQASSAVGQGPRIPARLPQRLSKKGPSGRAEQIKLGGVTLGILLRLALGQ